MNHLQARTTKLVLSGVLFLVPCGFADIIPVANSSFETLPVTPLPLTCAGTPAGSCRFSTANLNPIPDWATTNPGVSGQFQPGVQDGNLMWFNTLPAGNTIAYADVGTISQTVGPTVQKGLIYTLMVDIGFQKGGAAFAGTADVLLGGAGGTIIPATGSMPAVGDWSTYTATFVGTTANVGQSITIQLKASGSRGAFDDVRLTAVPEPGFYGVVGIGLAGLLAFARRKRSA